MAKIVQDIQILEKKQNIYSPRTNMIGNCAWPSFRPSSGTARVMRRATLSNPLPDLAYLPLREDGGLVADNGLGTGEDLFPKTTEMRYSQKESDLNILYVWYLKCICKTSNYHSSNIIIQQIWYHNVILNIWSGFECKLNHWTSPSETNVYLR